MKSYQESARSYLETLFGHVEEGTVMLSTLRDGAWHDGVASGHLNDSDTLEHLAGKAVELSADSDVYAAVTARRSVKRTEAATLALVALWLELDRPESSDGKGENLDRYFSDTEEMREFIAQHAGFGQPSLIIDSGGGFHAYWLLEEPMAWGPEAKRLLLRFKSLWLSASIRVGKGIDNVFDAARVLRVPGTVNHKYDPPRPVTILDLEPGRRYGLDDLEPHLPAFDETLGNLDSFDAFDVNPKEVMSYLAAISAPATTETGERIVNDAMTAVTGAKPKDSQHGRHPTMLGVLGRLIQRRDHPSVNISEAVTGELRDAWRRVRAGNTPDREYEAMVAWVVGKRLAEEHIAIDADEYAHRDHAAAAARHREHRREWTADLVSGGPLEVPDEEEQRARMVGLRLNDTDNATRFSALHGDALRFVHGWSTWIVWDGTCWVRDPKAVLAMEKAKDVSRFLYAQAAQMRPVSDAERKVQEAIARWANRSAQRPRIDAMVSLARPLREHLVNHEQLDADPWALNVANGWIDLRTGTHHPPDPEKLLTMQAPVAWDPDSEAPLWEQALAQWLPDPEDRDYFQRLAGAAIVGVIRDHNLVLVYGPGANGKGTMVGTLARVLGDYFTVPDKSLLVVQREEHSTVKAALFRTRLAVAAETDKRVKLNEAQVKELTGGDRLQARRIREDPWSFDPTHTLWLQTNHLPEIRGRDRGIWRRIRVLPWLTTFEGVAEDQELGEKLTDEGPGVLRWLVEGAVRWQEVGLGDDTLPESVRAATAQYRRDEDVVGRFCADEGLTVGNRDLSIPSVELLNRWSEWTRINLGRGVRGNDLAEALEGLGCNKETHMERTIDGRRTRVTRWHGIGLSTPVDPSPG